jgi:hypothetical protein
MVNRTLEIFIEGRVTIVLREHHAEVRPILDFAALIPNVVGTVREIDPLWRVGTTVRAIHAIEDEILNDVVLASAAREQTPRKAVRWPDDDAFPGIGLNRDRIRVRCAAGHRVQRGVDDVLLTGIDTVADVEVVAGGQLREAIAIRLPRLRFSPKVVVVAGRRGDVLRTDLHARPEPPPDFLKRQPHIMLMFKIPLHLPFCRRVAHEIRAIIGNRPGWNDEPRMGPPIDVIPVLLERGRHLIRGPHPGIHPPARCASRVDRVHQKARAVFDLGFDEGGHRPPLQIRIKAANRLAKPDLAQLQILGITFDDEAPVQKAGGVVVRFFRQIQPRIDGPATRPSTEPRRDRERGGEGRRRPDVAIVAFQPNRRRWRAICGAIEVVVD